MDISLDQEQMSNNIIKSFNETPELWIVKSYELIYIPDQKAVKELRKMAWPEHDSNVGMIIEYNVYQVHYVKIKKPFTLDFSGYHEEKMVIEIKKFLYNHFKNQVGILVEKEEQRKTNKKVTKEKITVEDPVIIGIMPKL
jgi:hypothetical protein